MRGRDQSQPRSRFSVVRTDNKPRTQNGHIRNNTRDVLRRISGPSNGAICRRMCVASDRSCTRVTARNLHGKEGVDGSSPSEGSAKAPQVGAFSFRWTCSSSNVRWVWRPLWSRQVETGTGCGEGRATCPTFADASLDAWDPAQYRLQSARRQQPVGDVSDTVAEVDRGDRARPTVRCGIVSVDRAKVDERR